MARIQQAWLVGTLALLAVGGGCRLTAPPGPLQAGRSDGPTGGGGCPTGQCDPDPNGLGIYIAEGDDYCFQHEGRPVWCPEGFLNTAEGVLMRVRSTAERRTVLDVPVRLTRPSEPEPEAIGVLTGLHASPADFFVALTQGGESRKVRGASLAKLSFYFHLPVDVGGGDRRQVLHELSLGAPEAGRFQVRYRVVGTGDWQPQCRATGGQGDARSVLLPGRQVDGLSAAVRERASAVTLACETGAIAACLKWKYQPWDPETHQDDAERELVYRSCLQAKRAAYFVGQGDLRAFTVSGTPFLRRDAHGFDPRTGARLEDLEALEALWGPRGAVCLNPENRRQSTPPLPKGLSLPRCGPAPQWRTDAPLATGVPRAAER